MIHVHITKYKLVLLTTWQPLSQVTRCWGEESDIWKAMKPRRWQTGVLKKHHKKIQNSDFLSVKAKGKQEGLKVIEDHRHLEHLDIWTRWLRQQRKIVKLPFLSLLAVVDVSPVTSFLQIFAKQSLFYTIFPYLFGDIVTSKRLFL